MQRYFYIFAATLAAFVLPGCGAEKTEQQTPAAQAQAAPSQPSYRWRMVTSWPPNFPVFQEGVQRFAQDVETMSQGRLKIQVFSGGELVPPLQVFDAVSQGTVEIGHAAAYYWSGKIPAAQIFTTMPFGMNAQGMNTWMYSGGGLELWREVYAPHNLVPFPMGNTGVQMGGWFNKRIDSVADLKGLKMRIPGLGGQVLAKAGGNPVLLPGGEIYSALERHTIDATEWVGPYHDQRLGLPRIAKYYYYPGWQEPGPSLELILNKKVWEALPADLQRIVAVAAQATDLWMLTEFEAKNLAALEEIKQSKVEILPFPDDVITTLRQLTEQTLQEQAEKDPLFAKVYQSYRDYQARYEGWAAISENAYQDALKR